MNRLTRDVLLIQALDLADLPTLDNHDRSTGSIDPAAFCISWLQDALDLFLNQFPLAASLKAGSVTLVQGVNQITAPADFILDVKHGLVIPQNPNSNARRLFRTPYQKMLTYQTYSPGAGCPRRYTTLGARIVLWPVPDVSYAAILNYYAMPPVLAGGDIPMFPSDQILIDCVKLRALEWARQEQPGTALAYARKEIAKIRSSGLFNESEDNQVPLDPEQFVHAEHSPWGWMGPWSQMS
jgi:hypothetical protein